MMLFMAVMLSVLLAGLVLSVGFGFLAALFAYSFGGTTCLLLLAYSAHVQTMQGFEFRS